MMDPSPLVLTVQTGLAMMRMGTSLSLFQSGMENGNDSVEKTNHITENYLPRKSVVRLTQNSHSC